MRVIVWPADRQGSGHYRLIFPADALERQGAEIEVTDHGPSIGWDREFPGDGVPLDPR
jgi:hypothetical protein